MIDCTLDTPGITDVPGFTCAGVACNIRGKDDGRLDLTLIYSAEPCTASGVFTQSDLQAAPVKVCREHLKKGKAWHGIVANSGNANACTGQVGVADARAIAQTAARLLGLPQEAIFVSSTGIIGVPLPRDRLLAGVHQAILTQSTKPQAGYQAVKAILTSDTCPKSLTARFSWQGQPVTLGAIAKGGGMIQPNMATVLVFLATDARVPTPLLQRMLTNAVGQSFNRISVDGDMSTNDTVLVLANGLSQVTIPDDATTPLYQNFVEALSQVCHLLAEMIVADDARMTKVVEVNIVHASSNAAAEKVARAIANSPLVKTSWYGNDPNWGRIVHAAGYAGIGLQEHRLDLSYHSRSRHPCLVARGPLDRAEPVSIAVLKKGQAQWQHKVLWKSVVSRKHFGVTLDLHLGSGTFSMLSNDLSPNYLHTSNT